MRDKLGFAVLVLIAAAPTLGQAGPPESCDSIVLEILTVDQGHPWRPPFGLDRVGHSAVAHVELATEQAPTGLYLRAYKDGKEVERHLLDFQKNPSLYAGNPYAPKARSPFFAHVPLSAIPSEVALEAQCEGSVKEVKRQSVKWPSIEADAVARPERLINPVDLGAILPPHDWLLLAGGQSALIEVAAIAHERDEPGAKIRAWFDGEKPVETSIPLMRDRRVTRELKLPFTAGGERSTLHVSLTDGQRELWKKDIPAMVVAKSPRSPAFGAVETKLRYDAPIAAVDPKTGRPLPSIDYKTAWDPKFEDVVVFLPNGSRFVFWRGANYIPFWAGKYNTGVLYQWAENCSERRLVAHPDGSRDCPEPLFDSELRYGRVRIVESTVSRVHVRWEYQLTDVSYEHSGGTAAEDFYFYPDGFGTRVVTVPSVPGEIYQLSEFIIITPQAAYPLEVLPRTLIEALPLDGGKERVEFPHEPTMQRTTKTRPPIVTPREKPMVYRLFSHRDDPAAAIYFHPGDPAVPWAYSPFYDQGEMVTPVYWGNHWPLNRGRWTGWGINNEIGTTPSHSSVAGWSPPRDPTSGKWLGPSWEVAPLTSGDGMMPDARGQVRKMNLSRFVWLIAQTDLSDEGLREWGQSFSAPPTIEVAGARLDIPSYSQERRALRLVAESNSIEVRVKPAQRTVNPVFEIDEAPAKLAGVIVDDQILPADAYAWDGKVLWVRTAITKQSATMRLHFQ